MRAGDEDAFIVRADQLIEIGDPRGALIQVQHRLAASPKDRKLIAAQSALFAAHREALLGPTRWRRKSNDVTWKLGYFDKVTLHSATPEDVDELLAHESARYLRELEIVAWSAMPAIVLRLASTTRHSIRTLALRERRDDVAISGKHPSYDTGRQNHDHRKGDSLWAAFPALVVARVAGDHLFHTIDSPTLEELVVENAPFCKTAWKTPRLRSIHWTMNRAVVEWGATRARLALTPLWVSKLPALRILDLGTLEARWHDPGDPLDREQFHRALAAKEPRLHELFARLDHLVVPDKKMTSSAAIASWLAGA